MRRANRRREEVQTYLDEVNAYYGHYHDCQVENCSGIVFKRDSVTNSKFVADICPNCRAIYITRPHDGTFEWNVPYQDKRDKIVRNLMGELWCDLTTKTGEEPVIFYD